MKYLCSDRPINRFLSTLKLNIIDTDDLVKRQENFKEKEEEITNIQEVKNKLEALFKEHHYEEFYKSA